MSVGASATGRYAGRLYDDFLVGDVYAHAPGRTITDADNIWFSLLTMNAHPLHVDAPYAACTEFGKPVVNSALTLAILVGISVADVSKCAVANLGWHDVRLLAPVFVGDTIYGQTETLEKRLSVSRPQNGIVKVRTTGTKQDGRVFMTFERSFLIPVRAAAGGAPSRSVASDPRGGGLT